VQRRNRYDDNTCVPLTKYAVRFGVGHVEVDCSGVGRGAGLSGAAGLMGFGWWHGCDVLWCFEGLRGGEMLVLVLCLEDVICVVVVECRARLVRTMVREGRKRAM